MVPLPAHGSALDLGTGTGEWAVDLGDELPAYSVIGVDVDPVQPIWVPPNVEFQVDDVEALWTYRRRFTFIHVRHLSGSLDCWPRLIQQCYK